MVLNQHDLVGLGPHLDEITEGCGRVFTRPKVSQLSLQHTHPTCPRECVLRSSLTLRVSVRIGREQSHGGFGIVGHGASLGDHDLALTNPWLGPKEDVPGSVAFVFGVDDLRLAGAGWKGFRPLFDPLFCALLETDYRPLGIVRPFVDIPRVLPVAHEFGMGVGRDDPRLAKPRLEFVF